MPKHLFVGRPLKRSSGYLFYGQGVRENAFSLQKNTGKHFRDTTFVSVLIPVANSKLLQNRNGNRAQLVKLIKDNSLPVG